MAQKLSNYGDWEFQKKLGTGGFGEVSLWRNRKSNQYIATKRCLKDPSRMQLDELSKQKDRWLQEYKWMKNLNTECIVRGIDVDPKDFVEYLDKSHGWKLPVIIMEYCNGGDLRVEMQKIENLNGLHENDVRQVMRSLRNAIAYLHDNYQIVHRDIKPDNIVIHKCDGGRRTLYKLTDLGFSRNISTDTIAASVVGTKHYFAPEILDGARYTNTVDYWSLGIIAFEIICGVYPFIPHQSLFEIVSNIKKKDKNCIAITESASQPNSFICHTELFREMRSSRVFRRRMESWLRLALDKSHANRGYRVNIPQPCDAAPDAIQSLPRRQLTFYTELDAVLDCKILTVFSLNNYQFYSFEIDESTLMNQLIDAMEHDTGIDRKDFFFIFPTGHPRAQLTSITKPIDLYVDDFNIEDDSAVMLYLFGFKQEYHPIEPYISARIQQTMQSQINAASSKLPNWVAEEFVLHTNFLLNNEHKHLKAFICGLHEYALTVEHVVFHYEGAIRATVDRIFTVNGCVKQYLVMIRQSKEISTADQFFDLEDIFSEYEGSAQNFLNEIAKLEVVVRQKVDTRWRSALRRIRELEKNPYFDDIVTKDIFNVAQFKENVDLVRKKLPTDIDLLAECQTCIYNCLEERRKFLTSQQLDNIKLTIGDIHEEFRKIQEIVTNANQLISSIEKRITERSYEFQKSFWGSGSKRTAASILPKNNLNTQMSSLTLDGNSMDVSWTTDDNLFGQPPTGHLIQEAIDCMQLIQSMEADKETDSYPLTIDFHLEESNSQELSK